MTSAYRDSFFSSAASGGQTTTAASNSTANQMPLVKLDMSLVRDVHKFPTKQKLIRSMTALCKDMGMMVVGEGVETVEERRALTDLGCDLLQGYLFARPGPAFPGIVWGPD